MFKIYLHDQDCPSLRKIRRLIGLSSDSSDSPLIPTLIVTPRTTHRKGGHGRLYRHGAVLRIGTLKQTGPGRNQRHLVKVGFIPFRSSCACTPVMKVLSKFSVLKHRECLRRGGHVRERGYVCAYTRRELVEMCLRSDASWCDLWKTMQKEKQATVGPVRSHGAWRWRKSGEGRPGPSVCRPPESGPWWKEKEYGCRLNGDIRSVGYSRGKNGWRVEEEKRGAGKSDLRRQRLCGWKNKSSEND